MDIKNEIIYQLKKMKIKVETHYTLWGTVKAIIDTREYDKDIFELSKIQMSNKLIKRFEQEKEKEKPYSVTNLVWERAIRIINELSNNDSIT